MDDTAATEAEPQSSTPGPDDKVSPFAGGATPTAPTERGPSVPLTVTEAALAQVLDILAAEDDPDALGLRIEVTGINGTEYTYDLAFEEKSAAADDDLQYQQGTLSVMIPVDSVDPLWGATLDLPSTPGQAGLVIRNPNRPDPLTQYDDVELVGTVHERVDQLLSKVINPGLASHGGFAQLVELIDDDTRAVITMGGGCQGCAVSAMTLREGIQKTILERVPEIVEVVDATDHDAGENPFYT
jgi:Fe/S biogenesis protein NfuA